MRTRDNEIRRIASYIKKEKSVGVVIVEYIHCYCEIFHEKKKLKNLP